MIINDRTMQSRYERETMKQLLASPSQRGSYNFYLYTCISQTTVHKGHVLCFPNVVSIYSTDFIIRKKTNWTKYITIEEMGVGSTGATTFDSQWKRKPAERMTHPNTLSTIVHGEAISINIWHQTTPSPPHLQNIAGFPPPLPWDVLFLDEKKKYKHI